MLHWLDDDDRHRYWAMPAELLAGDGSEYRRILLSRGMRLSNSLKARQLLSLFIQQMGELTTQKAISVNCIGWHNMAYVHPHMTFYPSQQQPVSKMVLQTMHPIKGFIQQGNSDSWRQAILCQMGIDHSEKLVFLTIPARVCIVSKVTFWMIDGFLFYSR